MAPGLHLADVHFFDNAALRHACHVGDLPTVRMLVSHGADVMVRDGTSLALAAGGGHVEVARYLIEEAGE